MTKAPRRAPLILRDVDEAEDAVRAGGLRLTAARRAVLAALFAAEGPVSAEEIAAGLGGRVTATEISSVYRNLELLEQLGVVRHLHAGHGPGRYVLEAAGERGYLACESCGAIVTLEGPRARGGPQVGARRERLRARPEPLPRRRPLRPLRLIRPGARRPRPPPAAARPPSGPGARSANVVASAS